MKLFITVLAIVALSNGSSAARVSPTLLPALQSGPQDIMIIVGESTTTSVLNSFESRNFASLDDKATALSKALKEVTAAHQAPILEVISKYKTGSEVQGFYITDRISVRNAEAALIEELALRDDIVEIREAKVFHIETPIAQKEETISQKVGIEWGVDRVKAPSAWQAGFTGQGIVVSNIDTGVRGTHEVLRDNYRGDANYGWFDPRGKTTTPSDSNGHGSHTMGSIAGKTGTGVAPNSTWIACMGCPAGSCPEDTLLGCGEWTFCPTLTDGTEEDCSKRPRVSSNSWGGGGGDPFYSDIVDTWNEVGIIPVFSMGNEGPGCRTAGSPGDFPNLIGVGATTDQDRVASFSSHGPTLVGQRIKPDLSAPGQDIRSCSSEEDDGYAVYSGTSMATPHVAGAVAVLLEKNPAATRIEIANALQDSTVRPSIGNIVCTGGGVNITNPWPNNSFGYGIIDVNAALANI